MPDTQWTVERVKAELPEVKVRLPTEIATGIVTGHLQPYARIAMPGVWSFWVAWQTIADCLNADKPVHY